MPRITSDIKAPKQNIFKRTVGYFRGQDSTNHPANVEPARACDCLNSIRDVPGKPRKRMGYYLFREYGARINGAYSLDGRLLIHSGTELYLDGETPELLGAMADERSYCTRLEGRLWILDGESLKAYGDFGDGFELKTAESIAYVPTVTISRAPSGGGEAYEEVNLLSDRWTESFLGEANVKDYQLSFDGLSDEAVTAEIRNADGEWTEKTEGTDFTVDRATGTVTFNSAPGASPVTGEDNVRITAAKDRSEGRARINGCRFSIAYGVNGASDRLFISGNPDYPNVAYYSALNDPTYFGDLSFCAWGQSHSPIVGFSVIDGKLANHKRNDDEDRNIFTCFGSLDGDGDPQFTQEGIIQGAGGISPYTFAHIDEPLFLTETGICAATPYIYNSRYYVQNRSFYANGLLLDEDGLRDAFAIAYKDFYMLALNGRVYILDTLGKSENESLRSNYQLDFYMWDNVPARVLFTVDGCLYFGTEDGRIMRFYTDKDSLASYSDDGEPIRWRWDMEFSGNNVYLKKRIKYLYIRMAPAPQTSFEVYVQKEGIWEKRFSSVGNTSYWDFDNIDFDNAAFSGNTNPRTVRIKLKVKKFDAVRVSIRNGKLNEPTGLYELDYIFTEGGYFKG